MWTPKYFTSGFSSIGIESKIICSLKSFLLLLPNIMNSVLEVLTVGWCSWKNRISLFAFCSNLILLLSMEVSKVKLTVSSLYCMSSVSLSTLVAMSLMYRLNRSGPSTVPCGTPLWSISSSDMQSCSITDGRQFVTKLLNRFFEFSSKPKLPNLISKMS